MTDDLDPLLRRALDAYRVPEVPADLEDAVVERLARPGVLPTARWRRGAIAGAVLAAAAAIVVLAVRRAPPQASGQHATAARATVEIGARAVAVAEAGAELRWHVRGDAARVTQDAGDVFYRVEHGGTFVVETPSGTIEVRGTCFRVEVQAMRVQRQSLVASGVSALVAAATVVLVYEGGVRVASSRGDVTLAPGERARIEPGHAPVVEGDAARGIATAGAPGTVGHGAVVAQNGSLRDQLAAAQGRIASLEQYVAELEAATGKTSNVDPTKEQLALWATRCEVHIDAPSVFRATPSRIDPKQASEWGLSKDELAAVERGLADLHERARDEMRDIYLAATGNTTVADEVTAGAMMSEIFDKAVPADSVRARYRIARERAGLDKPPANLAALPPVERALRLIQRLGGDFEQLLAESLTPARSHELRKAANGWPGLRLNDTGCEERSR